MRSVKGTVGSMASCNTRSLNESQLNSRLIMFIEQICTKALEIGCWVWLRLCEIFNYLYDYF
jgi:hypothetical protein